MTKKIGFEVIQDDSEWGQYVAVDESFQEVISIQEISEEILKKPLQPDFTTFDTPSSGRDVEVLDTFSPKILELFFQVFPCLKNCIPPDSKVTEHESLLGAPQEIFSKDR